MEILLLRHSSIARCLRRRQTVITVGEIKQLFDDIVTFLNKLASGNRKNDGMHILTNICDELAGMNTLQLFDHAILRNHQIFIYVRRTFEMLLTKSNHSQTITMTKQEEDCFYATSYLIAQLCLYRNETVELFYGKVSKEILQVTEKPNLRDETINKNIRKAKELAGKPNLKVARLSPNAPEARPIEQREVDITKICRRKHFPPRFISVSNETKLESSTHEFNQVELPSTKYQDIFLTSSILNKLIRAIDDLSRNEYPPYHVKYKVVDRLVRLCSKLNIVDVLLDPVVKCLRSKYYHDVFETIELDQIRMNPKQLFFIHECPQFIIQHNFQRKEEIPDLLCKTLIDATKSIFDKQLLTTDVAIDSNDNGDRRIAIHALSCHIELLYHFSLTSSSRQHFLQTGIADQLLRILRQGTLINSAHQHEYLFNADVSIVAYCLMLLSNLAYEQQIFSTLKQANIQAICSQLQSAKEKTIQYASKILLTILDQETIEEKNEPAKLKEAYLKFLENILDEPKHQKKSGVSRNIKDRDNDTKYRFLTESFLERLIRDIKHLSNHNYESNVSKYKDTVRRVRVCSKQETNEVESLLDPIIACLTSEYYVNVYKKIELSQTKAASGVMHTSHSLAAKHLLFMRECPEFLMRHDYKRQDEIASLLCKKMLEITAIIFGDHLSILIGNEDEGDDDERKNARVEALSYHIKLLNHFALTASTRKDFLATPIIDQILRILSNETLVDNAGRIVDAKVMIVGQSLTLLYNLAFDNQILSVLKTKNLLHICSKLCLVKDKMIQFASQTLRIIFDPSIVDNIPESSFLSKTYIEYLEKSVKEPRQPCQGVKLDGILKNFEVIIKNDSIQENVVEEKEGISSITQCVLVKCPDNPASDMFKSIRRSALDIVWELLISFCGPSARNKMKLNDLFIEHLLTLLNGTSKKLKRTAKNIIWKLGNEETIRSEQTEKEKERKQERQRKERITTTDEQLTTNDQWDDSVPFDLMISYSNNLHDKIICHKICNRLITKHVRVYIEKQGKHRLELMQKAVAKRKIILACLSTNYRSSKVCMAEVEYAFKYKCPIIPVLVETNYKTKGWLNHLVGGKNAIDFTEKNFDDAILKLIVEIDKIKASD